jgi:hypothetical protein
MRPVEKLIEEWRRRLVCCYSTARRYDWDARELELELAALRRLIFSTMLQIDSCEFAALGMQTFDEVAIESKVSRVEERTRLEIVRFFGSIPRLGVVPPDPPPEPITGGSPWLRRLLVELGDLTGSDVAELVGELFVRPPEPRPRRPDLRVLRGGLSALVMVMVSAAASCFAPPPAPRSGERGPGDVGGVAGPGNVSRIGP